jgi:hypothetical protein
LVGPRILVPLVAAVVLGACTAQPETRTERLFPIDDFWRGRTGLEHIERWGWLQADIGDDERTVTLRYRGGVEPLLPGQQRHGHVFGESHHTHPLYGST